MLIKVFCVESMLSKLLPPVCLRGGGGGTSLLNKGGGSNRLPVEFPQVQTSSINNAETGPLLYVTTMTMLFKFMQ